MHRVTLTKRSLHEDRKKEDNKILTTQGEREKENAKKKRSLELNKKGTCAQREHKILQRTRTHKIIRFFNTKEFQTPNLSESEKVLRM